MSLYGGPYGDLVIVAIYALSFAALNTISFLIALFYKKKFKQSSPRWGFIIAVLFAFVFVVFLLAGRTGPSAAVFQSFARSAAAVSAVASAFSTVSLIFIMQRVRK